MCAFTEERTISMAQRKKSSSAGRRPAAKREAAGRAEREAVKSARHQMAAVLVFAGAILLFCLAIIRGDHLWLWLHNLVMGLFGVCAYILPVLMIYIAVVAAMEKPVGGLRSRLWQSVLLLVLIGSAIHVFTADIPDAPGHNFFESVGRAWTDGIAVQGGGVAGAVLGYPMEYFFTDLGAKIILLLLIFVFLMLVTGTTILALFRTAWKPVKKTKETLENAMITGAERRRAAVIVVDLGEGYPEAEPPRRPSRADKPSAEEKPPCRIRPKRKKNPKSWPPWKGRRPRCRKRRPGPPPVWRIFSSPARATGPTRPLPRRRLRRRALCRSSSRRRNRPPIWTRIPTLTGIPPSPCWMNPPGWTIPRPPWSRRPMRSCWFRPSRNSA